METENVQEGVEVLEISNTAVLFIRPDLQIPPCKAFEARDAPSELSQGVSQSRRQLLANHR
jgi:hypothetical protein